MKKIKISTGPRRNRKKRAVYTFASTALLPKRFDYHLAQPIYGALFINPAALLRRRRVFDRTGLVVFSESAWRELGIPMIPTSMWATKKTRR